MSRLRLLTAAVLLAALLLSGCSTAPDTLSIQILSIGKADCSVFRQGSHAMVIDCGEESDGAEILAALRAQGISQLDYLIITHFDKDHVGGAALLLRSLSVAQVIEPDYTPENPTSAAYTTYRQALADTGVPVTALSDTLELTLGTASVTVTGTKGAVYTKNTDNNNSLLVSIVHAGNRFLFAGDIEKQRIQDLLTSGLDGYDFLKVPHHGVYNSALPELFAALQIRYAAITCSQKNPPEDKTLAALDTLNIQTYLTADGTITLTSTPSGIQITQ